MRIPRQTNLRVEDIREILTEGDDPDFPICLLINDLGAIALNGENGSDEAEKILVSELKCVIIRRWTAIRLLCTLAKLDKASDNTLTAIREFRDNPENSTIFPSDEEIGDAIADMKALQASMN